MIALTARHVKILELIRNPFDPISAKIIGGAGGLMFGLSIAGSIVAHGNLRVPAVVATFTSFSVVGALVGISIIKFAARNSASLSTIIFAIAGADFAGAIGAIMATALAGVTNAVLYTISGKTLDNMFADGLIASIKGVDQIIKDSREAIADMPIRINAVSMERSKTQAKPTQHINDTLHQQTLTQVQPQLQQQDAMNSQKSRKSFAAKLDESRGDVRGLKPKKKSKDSFAKQLEEERELSEDKLINR